MFTTGQTFGQSTNFCLTPYENSSAYQGLAQAVQSPPGSANNLASTPYFVCSKYMVKVYFHYVVTSSNFGYHNGNTSTSINNVILTRLNNQFTNYGIRFKQVGNREWTSDTYASSTAFIGTISSITTDANANPVSDALNIYLLPINSPIAGGKAFTFNNVGNILVVGGNRTVQFCGFSPQNYEMAQTQVIPHEVGHCLGLRHTQDATTGDGDDLWDTPLDFNTENGCVNPNSNNCGIIYKPTPTPPGVCGSCVNPMPGQTPVVDNVMSPMLTLVV